jgi:hypothetical protein
MSGTLVDSRPPRGLLRLGLRGRIWLYRARWGWLPGDRFLMLVHVGRNRVSATIAQKQGHSEMLRCLARHFRVIGHLRNSLSWLSP